ncbi:hypothetical protein MTR67_043582 [Solanum verrucosum]|uniref:Uncharacterized protein n=1 Tax=Solanum verrucosum TaxID=315347 RepID=A0AAF0UPN8_SOLVR|nr:hypothetical protein MTR67_043582 [Solanum verrucosum]
MKICGSPKPFGVSPNDLTSPFVPVCCVLKERIKLTVKRSNRQVAEQFREAVLCHLMIKNTTILKANGSRR